jgi:hypothetical protein
LLKFYNKETNRRKHLNGKDLTHSRHIVKPIKSSLINCQIGFLRTIEVKAGDIIGLPVVISHVNSIMCINFETDMHDI